MKRSRKSLKRSRRTKPLKSSKKMSTGSIFYLESLQQILFRFNKIEEDIQNAKNNFDLFEAIGSYKMNVTTYVMILGSFRNKVDYNDISIKKANSSIKKQIKKIEEMLYIKNLVGLQRYKSS